MRCAVALLLAAAWVAVACNSSPVNAEVLLASGHLGDTPWQLALHDVDDGACLEVRFAIGSTSGVCAEEDGSFGGNVVEDPRGNGRIVLVQVDDDTMVAGAVTFELRPSAPVLMLPAGPYGRIAVAAIEGHQQPLAVELRNAGRDRHSRHELP